LSEDIQRINNSIELEKMRFNQTLEITFKVEDISEDLKIAPMLLIPFIENSFKHGILASVKTHN
jgi:LytS/YehU family sensor histidine kinase